MTFNHRQAASMSRSFTKRGDHIRYDASALSSSAPTSQNASNSANARRYSAQSSFEISSTKEFKLQELAMLSIAPIFRSIHHWWLMRAERHYLICADVEEQRAREAQMNVAYYQKRAALARSARY